jgi:iduronate 2-sulfatase
MRTLFISLVVALLSTTAHGTDQKLNVLFIAVDDLRPDLGAYGHPIVQSPNMDALSRSGLQFNRAYCQLALCNPSRASLLAGRRVETLGVYDLATFVRRRNPDVVTLPELFKNNGYRTVRFGKIFHTTNGNHEDPDSWENVAAAVAKRAMAAEKEAAGKVPELRPVRDNFRDELPWGAPDVGDEELADGKIARNAIEALRQYKDQPFFIAVGFHKPHLPFVAPKRYWDLYDPADIALPANREHPEGSPLFASNNASELRRYRTMSSEGPVCSDEEHRRLIHGYYACVSYIDAQIGKLMAELDELGLRDSTVVILWGDHGYQLGEQGTWNKRNNWELATRVPMMISHPRLVKPGQQTDALVELIDMYPTLVELTGLPMPEILEGTSFVPLLQDPRRPWKRAAFSVYRKADPELGLLHGVAMRTARYRFVEWTGPGLKSSVYELYDHETDPQETRNIAADPEQATLVRELAQQLGEGWRGALPPG